MMEGIVAGKMKQGGRPPVPEGVNLPDPRNRGGQGGGEEQATPEEQEAFQRVEAAAMEMVFGEESSIAIAEQLKAGADNPAEVLGQTAMMIFTQIDEKSGGKIPETVMLQGALKVLNFLSELAESTGIFQVDDATAQQAVQFMLVAASEQGYITEDDIPAIQELIQSMDQGELQSMVSQQQQVAGVA